MIHTVLILSGICNEGNQTIKSNAVNQEFPNFLLRTWNMISLTLA